MLMEIYINSSWTKCYEGTCIAEAIVWSENGNHATISTTGITIALRVHGLSGALY